MRRFARSNCQQLYIQYCVDRIRNLIEDLELDQSKPIQSQLSDKFGAKWKMFRYASGRLGTQRQLLRYSRQHVLFTYIDPSTGEKSTEIASGAHEFFSILRYLDDIYSEKVMYTTQPSGSSYIYIPPTIVKKMLQTSLRSTLWRTGLRPLYESIKKSGGILGNLPEYLFELENRDNIEQNFFPDGLVVEMHNGETEAVEFDGPADNKDQRPWYISKMLMSAIHMQRNEICGYNVVDRVKSRDIVLSIKFLAEEVAKGSNSILNNIEYQRARELLSYIPADLDPGVILAADQFMEENIESFFPNDYNKENALFMLSNLVANCLVDNQYLAKYASILGWNRPVLHTVEDAIFRTILRHVNTKIDGEFLFNQPILVDGIPKSPQSMNPVEIRRYLSDFISKFYIRDPSNPFYRDLVYQTSLYSYQMKDWTNNYWSESFTGSLEAYSEQDGKDLISAISLRAMIHLGFNPITNKISTGVNTYNLNFPIYVPSSKLKSFWVYGNWVPSNKYDPDRISSTEYPLEFGEYYEWYHSNVLGKIVSDTNLDGDYIENFFRLL